MGVPSEDFEYMLWMLETIEQQRKNKKKQEKNKMFEKMH
jgi:hypothetical protein